MSLQKETPEAQLLNEQQSQNDISKPLIPLFIGLNVGFDFSTHKGSFIVSDSGHSCCTTSEGTGSGIHGGLVAFVPLSNWLYFTPRVGVEGRGGLFTTPTSELEILDEAQKLQKATVRHEMDISVPCVNADLMLAPVIFTRPIVYLCGGISAAVPLRSHYYSYERIMSPTSLNYSNGTQTRDAGEGELQNLRSVLFGARVGCGAIFKLRALMLQTEFLVHVPLQSLTKDESVNWRSTVVLIHIGLLRSW